MQIKTDSQSKSASSSTENEREKYLSNERSNSTLFLRFPKPGQSINQVEPLRKFAKLVPFQSKYVRQEFTPLSREITLYLIREIRENIREEISDDISMQPLYEIAVQCILDKSRWEQESRKDVDLDLHCFRRKDALSLVELLLIRSRQRNEWHTGKRQYFKIDTGKGSKSRPPVLLPSVEEYLLKQNVHFNRFSDTGIFQVHPFSPTLG